MSAGILDGERAERRWAWQLCAFTLAVFSMPLLLGGGSSLQVGFGGASVCLFIALFVTKPTAYPICAIAAVAPGGFELALGGKTPKIYFVLIVSLAYVVSVLVRRSLWRPKAGQVKAALSRSQRGARTIAICLAAYVVLILPSLERMIVPSRSLFLIVARLVILSAVICFAAEPRIMRSRFSVLLAVNVIGTIIAVAYMADAILVYHVRSWTELLIGLALKDNTVHVGVLGTTNTIASFLAVTLPLTIAFTLLPAVSGVFRTAGVAGIVAQSLGLLGTASRGGVVAVIGGIILAAILCQGSVKQLPKLLGFLAVATLTITVGYFLMGDAIKEKFASRFEYNSIGNYILDRGQLWLSSWRAFVSNPLLGIGVGNVGFYDIDFGTGQGSESHNLALQTLAEEGIIAFVLLGAAIGRLVSRSVVVGRRGSSTRIWIVVAMISGVIDCMVEPTFWHPPFAVLFWTLGVFLYRDSFENENDQPIARPVSVRQKRRIRQSPVAAS